MNALPSRDVIDIGCALGPGSRLAVSPQARRAAAIRQSCALRSRHLKLSFLILRINLSAVILMAIDRITVRGARQHNLKNINLEIPRNRLTVITGLSGSGKSSLAFDPVYAEGHARYLESPSAYARQFLEQLEKPDVDAVEGLSPAISIEQKTTSRSPRSTVGTVTEVYDYLRLLFSSVGQPHCQTAGGPCRANPPTRSFKTSRNC